MLKFSPLLALADVFRPALNVIALGVSVSGFTKTPTWLSKEKKKKIACVEIWTPVPSIGKEPAGCIQYTS